MADLYSAAEVKAGFKKLDTNKDGQLEYKELRDMLIKGQGRDAKITEKQLRLLYRSLDHDKDGKVNCDEFTDFVFGTGKPRTVKDRWQDTWDAFAGENECMEKEEFQKLCTASGLCDDVFDAGDAAEIFDAVVKKGKTDI